MTCTDCGQPTLFDGICVECSDKRFDQYPIIKEKLEKIIANLKEKKIWEQVKSEIE
jgi:hypothetical protein